MTHEEDAKHLLRNAADKYDAAPPPVAELLRSGKRAKKRRNLMMVTGTVVAVAAVAMGGFVLRPVTGSGALPVADTTQTQPPEDGASVLERIKGLTGKDVGDALGLELMATGSAPCDAAFVEFDDPPGDGNGMGFCLEGVTDDPRVERLVGGQIAGRLPVDVPNVVGLRLEDAEAIVRESDLHASVLLDGRAFPPGSGGCPITPDAVVTRQDPVGGQLPSGGMPFYMTLYVDSGVSFEDCPETRPGPVVVAHLRDSTPKDASRLAQEYLNFPGVDGAGADRSEITVTLFTEPDVTEQELATIMERLQDEPGVEEVFQVEVKDL